MKKPNFIYILACMLFIFLLSSNVFGSDDVKLNSKSAMLFDCDDQNILFNKNSFEKVFPASTTKILTAIIAIENLDLSNNVIVSSNAIDSTPDR